MSSPDHEWIAMRFGDSSASNTQSLEDYTPKMKTNKTGIRCLIFLCLLQALTIIAMLVFGYLYHQNAILSDFSEKGYAESLGENKSSDQHHNVYRVYIEGSNVTKVLMENIQGCGQREHDLNFATTCHSDDIKSCPKLSLAPTNTRLSDYDGEPKMVMVVTTSKSGLKFDTTTVPIKKSPCHSNNSVNCLFKTRLSVDLMARQQSIIGWGGSLTDSSISNILSLTVNGTKRLLDDYFSKTDGLGYNMIRITIGSSDFSPRFYTNDDLSLKEEDDLFMDKFRLMEEDKLYKIPILKYVKKEYDQNVKIFGSMWSPPTWMKTNGHFNKGLMKGSINISMASDEDIYFRALANLKIKLLKAYHEDSIKFWGLTVMNEPLFAIQPFLDFNSIIFPPNDYAAYLAKILGPKIREDSDLKQIKIMVHDDNRRYLMSFTDKVLSRPGVGQYVDGIATHGYIDEDYHLMSRIHDKYNGSYFILPDELCSGHLPFMEKALIGNWARGIHYALDIIRSLQNRAAGWVDWNMALDTQGGPGWLGGRLDSPIIVDKARDTYYRSPMFYVLGHFSRYIPTGSIKLETTIINNSYDYEVETVTFLLTVTNQLATVVLNNNPYHIDISIEVYSDLHQQKHIHSYQVVCQPDSITTFISSIPVY